MQKPKFKLNWLIILILALGIFFRFINLDKKVYWHDEVYTKLHLAGYLSQEWQPVLFNGQIHTIEDLQKYQRLTPEKGLKDTLKTLAIEDPHHPPLYYIIARFWVENLGNSITVIRSLSAFFSLLTWPAIYWLCRELFNSSRIGLVAVLVSAVSPFFVLYAQEAREYSLWTVIILASSAALLRALRLTSAKSAWGVYTLFLTLGLYTSFFSSLFILAHSLYILIREKFRLTKIVISYGIALTGALILFLPWIIVFIANYEQYQRSTSWAKLIKIPPLDLLKIFGLNISFVFFDFGLDYKQPWIFLVIILVLILVLFSIYSLYRTTSIEVWGFILTLIIVPIAILLIPDLLFGGVRSLSPRYLIPSWLGIELVIAYLLTNYFSKNRPIWTVLTAIIFSGSIISCTVNSIANTSWTKVISYSLPQVAEIINQSDAPLLVGNKTSYNPGNLIALSYLLKPDSKIQLLSDEKKYTIPYGFKQVFLLSPSDELRQKLEKEQQVKFEMVFRDDHLWLWKMQAQKNLPNE